MREELPAVVPNQAVISLLESVGRGHMVVSAAIDELQKLLEPSLGDCADADKVAILAIRYLEALKPDVVGRIMPEDQMKHTWAQPNGPHDPHARLRMAFILCSCIQITSLVSDLRTGAKALQQAMDQILPED